MLRRETRRAPGTSTKVHVAHSCTRGDSLNKTDALSCIRTSKFQNASAFIKRLTHSITFIRITVDGRVPQRQQCSAVLISTQGRSSDDYGFLLRVCCEVILLLRMLFQIGSLETSSGLFPLPRLRRSLHRPSGTQISHFSVVSSFSIHILLLQMRSCE